MCYLLLGFVQCRPFNPKKKVSKMKATCKVEQDCIILPCACDRRFIRIFCHLIEILYTGLHAVKSLETRRKISALGTFNFFTCQNPAVGLEMKRTDTQNCRRTVR